MIELIGKDEEQSIARFEMFDMTETWQHETSYVNGFFSKCIEEFKMVESDGSASLER